ncbi:MAG: hypothetical protein ACI8T1_000379 [Verrucomicrobiales bacterium]|jgi:hypothetical protein
MSLKAFHIFFIAMAILITLGFSVWVFAGGASPDQVANLSTMAAVSGILGLGLIGYGFHFIRKSRHIIV